MLRGDLRGIFGQDYAYQKTGRGDFRLTAFPWTIQRLTGPFSPCSARAGTVRRIPSIKPRTPSLVCSPLTAFGGFPQADTLSFNAPSSAVQDSGALIKRNPLVAAQSNVLTGYLVMSCGRPDPSYNASGSDAQHALDARPGAGFHPMVPAVPRGVRAIGTYHFLRRRICNPRTFDVATNLSASIAIRERCRARRRPNRSRGIVRGEARWPFRFNPTIHIARFAKSACRLRQVDLPPAARRLAFTLAPLRESPLS